MQERCRVDDQQIFLNSMDNQLFKEPWQKIILSSVKTARDRSGWHFSHFTDEEPEAQKN